MSSTSTPKMSTIASELEQKAGPLRVVNIKEFLSPWNAAMHLYARLIQKGHENLSRGIMYKKMGPEEEHQFVAYGSTVEGFQTELSKALKEAYDAPPKIERYVKKQTSPDFGEQYVYCEESEYDDRLLTGKYFLKREWFQTQELRKEWIDQNRPDVSVDWRIS